MAVILSLRCVCIVRAGTTAVWGYVNVDGDQAKSNIIFYVVRDIYGA